MAVYSKICTSYVVDTGKFVMNEADDFRKSTFRKLNIIPSKQIFLLFTMPRVTQDLLLMLDPQK